MGQYHNRLLSGSRVTGSMQVQVLSGPPSILMYLNPHRVKSYYNVVRVYPIQIVLRLLKNMVVVEVPLAETSLRAFTDSRRKVVQDGGSISN